MLEKIVRRHQGERHARGLRCRDQFVAMLCCQLGQTQRPREIYKRLQSSESKLVHPSASAPKPRSIPPWPTPISTA